MVEEIYDGHELAFNLVKPKTWVRVMCTDHAHLWYPIGDVFFLGWSQYIHPSVCLACGKDTGDV